jgi:hypothetical protein
LTVEISCTLSLFLRVPEYFTASTKSVNSKGLEHGWFIHHNPPAFYAEISSKKQNSSDSTTTLQLWCLSSRLFMFPKLAASIKECRYELTEELHSSTTAKADFLKIICRMLGKTELLLESLY